MKKITLLTALGLLAMTACNMKSSTENAVSTEFPNVLDLEAISEVPVTDLVDTVFYLPVPENGGLLPEAVGKIRFYNDKIYFSDHRYRPKRIFAYNRADGAPCFVVDAEGPGPDEYLGMRSFAVDQNGIAIIDCWQWKLMVYDVETGKFVRSATLPVQADGIEALDGSGYLMALVPYPNLPENPTIHKGDYRVYRTDSAMNVVKTYLALGDTTDALCFHHIFSRCGDNIAFGTMAKNGFYEYDAAADSLKFRRLGFKNGAEGKINISSDDIQTYDRLSDTPILAGDKIFIEYRKGDDTSEVMLYDRSTGRLHRVTDGSYFNLLWVLIKGSDGDSFVAYVDDKADYDMMVEKGLPRAPESIERRLDDEEGALIFVRMRQGAK